MVPIESIHNLNHHGIIIESSTVRFTKDLWDNAKEPYGGDRKNVIGDYHNPDVLSVDSYNNSGVWVSKTDRETWHGQGLSSSSLHVCEFKLSPDGRKLYADSVGTIEVINLEERR
jgi:hypothetical protein